MKVSFRRDYSERKQFQVTVDFGGKVIESDWCSSLIAALADLDEQVTTEAEVTYRTTDQDLICWEEAR